MEVSDGSDVASSEMAVKNDYFEVVVAIDFGTTYSGYAFSFCVDPLQIQTKRWMAGIAGLMSTKTPTSILLNPKGEFDAFGYDAERKYASLAVDGEHNTWALFRRFKMILHNEKTLSSESTIQDVNGNSAPAMRIFAMAIRYLKNEVARELNLQNNDIDEKNFKYVITVPAIWDDAAKQFMREAAKEAGIASERLQLALEPEVASIWCQTDSLDSIIALAGPGTRYMIVDLGGGTADISIHERLEGGSLKEIHKSSGGPWGGINFEVKKRSFNWESDAKCVIRFSSFLRDSCEKTCGQTLQDRIEKLGYQSEIKVQQDKLLVSATLVCQWFEGPVTSLINHIKMLLLGPTVRNVSTIVLVGGFSESKYVQNRVQKEIQGRCCIVPNEAGLAVLKGAVAFGHFPFAVKSRVLRYTYGVCIDKPFDSTIHTEESKFFKLQYNDWRARDCFKVFAAVDDEVRYDKELVYKFAQRGTLATTVRIFRSTEMHPVYVTDPGCELLGTIELNHTIDYVTIQITFMFGQTELMVKARLKELGRESIAVLDCLQKGKLKETGRGKP
ncbi:heat shock 70 kDa protein 12A-like [Mya arenaria]|uniref:heat shock 70 kDa protein 12A-like n=1 Tax=Mya arenaria TaxID=6604 RepID=UPI0022E1374F|nr:heat shock 70 kDa protein 12A-like [Mya arenaria]